jgi:hypothetical protein
MGIGIKNRLKNRFLGEASNLDVRVFKFIPNERSNIRFLHVVECDP